MTARWTYSFSNMGPKKQISGTTFYKVAIGKEVRWLSMEGIRMLQKAKEAGVSQKAVLHQTKHFTSRGPRARIKTMRANIMANIKELMGVEDMDRVRKGIMKMTELGRSEKLCDQMEHALSIMTEAELKYFWKHNRSLMEKFFENSDKLKGTPATAAEIDDVLIQKNINENAEKILDKMIEIMSRRGTPDEIR